ncbi:hypothetical protein HAX54_003323, partial [Datura stramonium]|nr:hypothetical protein [Datura stramonium]
MRVIIVINTLYCGCPLHNFLNKLEIKKAACKYIKQEAYNQLSQIYNQVSILKVDQEDRLQVAQASKFSSISQEDKLQVARARSFRKAKKLLLEKSRSSFLSFISRKPNLGRIDSLEDLKSSGYWFKCKS